MYEDIMQLLEAVPGGFELYRMIENVILSQWPDVEIRPKKTQVGFFDGCGFAWVSPPIRKDMGITLTLGLPERNPSPRIFNAVEPYPGRWTHHIPLSNPDEIDAEIIRWLEDAHQFALSRRRK